MLILSRKPGEKIVIDATITITVLEVGRNGQVRLGFDAPRSCQILRQELIDEIKRENVCAQRPDEQAAAAALLTLAAPLDEPHAALAESPNPHHPHQAATPVPVGA